MAVEDQGVAMAEPVRLVVWDLDETFWRGTLTEGGITQIAEHAEIVRELARRGIMSSICSKNDATNVRKALAESGDIWDYFVFPSINWEPKGKRIAGLIETIQLRPASVMFIDDNPMNLREASHFVPDLQVESERFILRLLDDARFRGKDDRELKRLTQYKLLERRRADEERAGADNTEFLRSSNIRVTFEHDLARHADRAIELINRTNQLNFTKRRLSDDPLQARVEFDALIRENYVKGALIKVEDNYGDYGFVGLYLLERMRLKYFCFSCRILHMGVEDYVYDAIGRPQLKVVGEVLTDLFRERTRIDWINRAATGGEGAGRVAIPAVRARGSCDLEAVTHYLRLESTEFLGEFSFVRTGLRVRLDHSALLRVSLEQQPPGVSEALEALGYRPAEMTTQIFGAAPAGTAIVFSNWADIRLRVYRHRELGFAVPFHLDGFRGDVIDTADADIPTLARFPELAEAAGYLRRHFVSGGVLPLHEIESNLKLVFSHIPPGTRLFALMPYGGVRQPDGSLQPQSRRVSVRHTLRDVASRFPSVVLVDVEDFIEDDSEVFSDDHFNRKVYFRLAQQISNTCRQLPSVMAAE